MGKIAWIPALLLLVGLTQGPCRAEDIKMKDDRGRKTGTLKDMGDGDYKVLDRNNYTLGYIENYSGIGGDMKCKDKSHRKISCPELFRMMSE